MLQLLPLLALASTPPAYKVLAFHNTKVEPDHLAFARDAIRFYKELAVKKNFAFETTTNWDDLNEKNLAQYRLVVWLNDSPYSTEQRTAFERYMAKGGGWLGCHVAGYNDKDTKWPWFVDFLGGAVFYTNNWPPLPASLLVDDRAHPVTRHLPTAKYDSPANEFYMWKPSPRLNKDVKVLVTLDPANYPLGKKDLLTEGDIPVVWTNTRYRMLYVNMGHGDKIFDSPLQNRLFEEALTWLSRK